MNNISFSPATLVIHGSSAKRYTKRFTLLNHAKTSLQGVVTTSIPGIRVEPRVFSIDEKSPFLDFTISIDSAAYLAHKAKSPPITLQEQIIVVTTIGKNEIFLTFEYIPAPAPQPASTSISTSIPIPKKGLKGTIDHGSLHPPQRFRSRKYAHKVHRRTVYLKTGEPLKLFSTGQSGGEGEIYSVEGHNTRCAKIFHPHIVTPELVEKIEYMVKVPPSSSLLSSIAWPTAAIYDRPDSGGRFLGFLMRYIDLCIYEEAHTWYDPQDREKHNKPPLGLAERVRVIYQLATVVHGLHTLGHAVGDLRETNLLVGSEDIVIIDCDSFQIRKHHSNSFYPTRVATAEYLPFEYQGKNFSKHSFSRFNSDQFALAVLIFKILMNGVHPYQSRGFLVSHAPSTSDKIKRGYFAFDDKYPGLSPPSYAPDYHSHVPKAFARCFTQTFVHGHKDPKIRAKPEHFLAACTATIADLLPVQPVPFSSPVEPSFSEKKQNIEKIKNSLPSSPQPVKSASIAPPLPPQPSKTVLRSPYYINNGISIVPGQFLWKMPTGTVYQIGSGAVYNAVFDNTHSLNSAPSCSAYSQHLSLLCSYHPIAGSLHGGVLWPHTLIFHRQNETEPVGYLIPAFDRTLWREWHEYASSSVDFPTRLTAAKNLADLVGQLHAKEYAAGQLSDQTVLVDKSGQVKLISVDAIAGRTKKALLKYSRFNPYNYCPMGENEALPDIYFHDRFALAVLVFMMIMNGSHPLHSVQSSYEPNGNTLCISRYSPFFFYYHRDSEFTCLPARLRAVFYRAFMQDPDLLSSTLPDSAEWYELMTDLTENALCCTLGHWYDRHQGYCPRCAEKFSSVQTLKIWFLSLRLPLLPNLKLLSPATEKQIWYMPPPRQYVLVGYPILLLNDTTYHSPNSALSSHLPCFIVSRDTFQLYLLMCLAEQVQCAWNEWYTLYTSHIQFTYNKHEVYVEASYHLHGEQIIGPFDISGAAEGEEYSVLDIMYEPITEDLFESIEFELQDVDSIKNPIKDSTSQHVDECRCKETNDVQSEIQDDVQDGMRNSSSFLKRLASLLKLI